VATIGDMSGSRGERSEPWLYSCDFQAAIATLVERLNLTTEPRTEFSAREWELERKALADLGEGLRPYGQMYAPNWNSLSDCLVDAFASGHLLVVRDIFPAAHPTIGRLVKVVGDYLGSRFTAPTGRVALVLEGWQPTTLTVATPTAWVTSEYPVTALDDPSARTG